MRLLAWRLGFGFAILLVWELAAGRLVDPFWFSSPLRILGHLVEWAREGSLFWHLFVTLRETFLGYALGSVSGIAVGVVLARLEFVAQVLDPFIVAANSIPRVALAPLFIIWFGIGELSKVILASTLTFFLTFYGTFSGLRAASPWIVAALKVGLPFAPTGAVSGILVLMISVMLVNGLPNRLERHVLRRRPRERAAHARELQ